MSRQGFTVEKLLEIVGENLDVGTQLLQGTGAPGGDAGEQDDAPVGSIYMRDTGEVHVKIADANVAADWFSYNDIYTILGMAPGDLDSGVYAGPILTDNTTVKANIQELADYISNVVDEQSSSNGVTADTVIDDELVDNILAVTWHVVISQFDDEAKRQAFYVEASHNGKGAADATTIDDTIYAKTKHGATFNNTVTVVLSGVGAAQVMQLKVASTETNGVNVRAQTVSKVNA